LAISLTRRSQQTNADSATDSSVDGSTHHQEFRLSKSNVFNPPLVWEVLTPALAQNSGDTTFGAKT
jgi:hypothetical protein